MLNNCILIFNNFIHFRYEIFIAFIAESIPPSQFNFGLSAYAGPAFNILAEGGMGAWITLRTFVTCRAFVTRRAFVSYNTFYIQDSRCTLLNLRLLLTA